MKQYLYLLIIIILITNTTALIAGKENTVTTINECEYLFVNITGTLPIHEEEYSLPYCDKIQGNNSWYCECNTNYYKLNITLDYRAMNNYNFNIQYYNKGELEPETITKTRTRTRTIYINETPEKEIIEKEVVKQDPEIIEKEVEKIVEVEKELNETQGIYNKKDIDNLLSDVNDLTLKQKTITTGSALIVLGALIILGMSMFYVYKKMKDR